MVRSITHQFIIVFLLAFLGCITTGASTDKTDRYAGSQSCVRCHDYFHGLWETSHHGRAMQPYTNALSTTLVPQGNAIKIHDAEYTFDLTKGHVLENCNGDLHAYPASYALGGKNVYYFLTKLDSGRLQTLPIGYDINSNEWFDVARSGIKHSSQEHAISWKDSLYTFNTSCYGCHVSQLALNYDVKKRTYQTTWTEPGINCETCHGPAKEHNEVCDVPSADQLPKDLKIIRGGHNGRKVFSAAQQNSSCGSCHAKMIPLAESFPPGEQFFNYYDLVTLEHPDYYPDGRDMGENYTFTSWMMSSCTANSSLDCLHCHTSSGRYRFSSPEKKNHDCLPCHQNKVNDPESHTHHKIVPEQAPGCTSCHMAKTVFARMQRSDHSMRPPTPATGILYGSPIACLSCHRKKDAQWADDQVRSWTVKDYQQPYIARAELVQAARDQDWSFLNAISEYISGPDREVVVANSLIRLLDTCQDSRKWHVLISALKNDTSPLVRASAAAALKEHLTPESISALANATADAFRLVRIRAAASLAQVPENAFSPDDKKHVRTATKELISALMARPDDYSSHFSLGNLYMDQGNYHKAIVSFNEAQRLRPDFLPPFVNSALAYNRIGKYREAKKSLQRALMIAPESSSVHLNMGLLLSGQGRFDESEAAFRQAFLFDSNSAVSAYNLGILLQKKNPLESVFWLRKAVSLAPEVTRYRFALTYVEDQTLSEPPGH